MPFIWPKRSTLSPCDFGCFFLQERYLMQIIRDLTATTQIKDAAIRRLVEQRIDDLGKEPFDLAALGYFLVVEPGDHLDAIDAQLGFPILANRYTSIRFDQPGFTPSFEFVEEFTFCFEMVFVLDDSGFGIEVFVPKAAGIDSDLLTMCQRYATAGAI